MCQRERVRSGQANNAVAGPPKCWVKAENHAMGIGLSAQHCLKEGRGHTRMNAPEALPHLFELPRRDAHARILPAVARLQKQKRRDVLHRSALQSSGQPSMSPPALVLILVVGLV